VRILHIVHQYSPDYVGGTELYTQNIARQQTKMGHKTAVLCPAPYSPSPNQDPLQPAVEEGVRVYRIPVGPRSRTTVFLNSFGHKRVEAAFTAVIAQEKPDIIHIQHLMGLPLSIAAQLKQFAPYLITLHDYWYVCANGQLITNNDSQTCDGPDPAFHNCGTCALARVGLNALAPLAPLVAPIMRRRNERLLPILQQAGRVIAPTHFVRQIYQAQGIPIDNMTVVRHGIDIPSAEIASLRQQIPYQPQRPLRVGYVGSIAWQKGVHLLITAVNQLPPDALHLTLFGSLTDFPDYAASLQQMATHPGIHFAGRVARHDLWRKLADIDLLVLPTLWYEASPLTIDEAFALGIPLVAAHIGAMGEKIRDGIDGRLFPPGQADALRDILADFVDNPDQLTALHQAIQPVRTTEIHLQEIDAIYRQLR
jgi:glycosyltransferase involved in cell wall biosynthesis